MVVEGFGCCGLVHPSMICLLEFLVKRSSGGEWIAFAKPTAVLSYYSIMHIDNGMHTRATIRRVYSITFTVFIL